jgi:hypothetical protein
MNQKESIILTLSFLLGFISKQVMSAESMSKDEILALTRDGNYRANPDELLHGFFPAWAFGLYLISGN